MTDKEIIDGVNVNECDNHYIENNKHICKYNFEKCNPKKEQCPLYVTGIEKQLKRKEQELEYYKIQFYADTKEMEGYLNEIGSHLESIEYLRTQLRTKEQECEELKEINQELLKYRKHSTTCQECYKDGLEDGKLDNKELRKLRKTLAEIKEIINEFAKEDILTFPDFSKEQNYKLIQKQCGEPILKFYKK